MEVRMKTWIRFLVVAGVLGLAACATPVGEPPLAVQHLPRHATLSGDQEVPPVTTGGSGEAVAQLEGNTLTVSGTFEDMESAATAAHVHGPAARGADAGIVFNLTIDAAVSGDFEGEAVLTDDQVADFLAGLYYVNIHSTFAVDGEIRGQLDEVTLEATLSGGQEVPPVPGAGAGSATAVLIADQLSLSGTFSDLSGDATVAHIHGPAPRGANAGIVFDLVIDQATSGVFSLDTSLTGPQMADFLAGLYYINIHTGLYPAGEIRGQLDE
jgi:hypothetical protein